MNATILTSFGLNPEQTAVVPHGSGLINRTWKLTTPQQCYILQKLNEAVFTNPAAVAGNHRLLAGFLAGHHPDYLFVAPVPATNGQDLVYFEGDGWYRLLPFVSGSHTIDAVKTPQQAFEAARQFARFTRLLSGLDARRLKTTIPAFHDLHLRYQQFLYSLQTASPARLQAAAAPIEWAKSQAGIVETYKAIRANPAFRLRVTHHDTKISNVLFDEKERGLCVIDLDTVMPGYFISDVGDMMRTYLSPVSEEEQDFSRIEVREEYYRAVLEGYYSEMKDELTAQEKSHFFYAGTFLIYMQALRFLTDFLNNDRYYGAAYKEHNVNRAVNQFVLLDRLLQKKTMLENY